MASKLLTEFQKVSNRGEMMQCRVPRELEVLKLVAQGMSNRRIAEELSTRANTANNHMRKHHREAAPRNALIGSLRSRKVDNLSGADRRKGSTFEGWATSNS